MTELKPFLEDMLSMSTGTDGRTLQIHFSRPVTKDDRQAIGDAHNAIVRGVLTSTPQPLSVGRLDALEAAIREAIELLAERKYGDGARSPGHNARLCLQAALTAAEASEP